MSMPYQIRATAQASFGTRNSSAFLNTGLLKMRFNRDGDALERKIKIVSHLLQSFCIVLNKTKPTSDVYDVRAFIKDLCPCW